jgi:acyl-CoA dehydrogenase
MRTVAKVRKAFDQMCERALSRRTQGELLAEKQLVQEKIADSYIDIEQFRLLVLRTAWRIDRYRDYKLVRGDISAVKAAMPRVYLDVYSRALQVHGALGLSNEMSFSDGIIDSFHMGLADGPTEVHKVTLAREILKGCQGTDDLFPTTHLPRLREEARRRYAALLEHEMGNA